MTIHLKLFKNDDEWNAAKAGLASAGHAEVESVKSNTAHLLAHIETQYPQIVEDIKKGIADLKDSSLSGGEKAVKVAIDVAATVPDAIKAIPGIKDVLVAGVTQWFADEVSDFKHIAEGFIEKL